MGQVVNLQASLQQEVVLEVQVLMAVAKLDHPVDPVVVEDMEILEVDPVVEV
jgi:hypothetical protein